MIQVYTQCKGFFSTGRKLPRDLINESTFPIHHKRAYYLLEKWIGRGFYEYGVSLDLGWLTREGKVEAIRLMGQMGPSSTELDNRGDKT
ncbi:MAG: hypothetical protein QME66_04810 [Candidatus Eisenbacteria bacterium]|nr:hypothetical protein [Candidatus Eisenbacteria bacterium]